MIQESSIVAPVRRVVARNVLAFALALALSALAISGLTRSLVDAGESEEGGSREYTDKEEAFFRWYARELPPRYLLFFGPSTTEYAIEPGVFDARAAELGLPMASFNMGLAGASGHEVDYQVRHTFAELERRGVPGPSWVVLDTSLSNHSFQWAESEEDIGRILSSRSEEWHDFYQLRAVLLTILRDDARGWPLKLKSGSLHLRVAARRFARRKLWRRPPIVGVIHRARQAPGPTPSRLRVNMMLEQRGYRTLGEDVLPDVRREFLESLPEGYAALVAAKRAEFDPPGADLRRYNHEAMRRLVEFLRERKVEVVCLVAPVLLETRHAHALNAAGLLPHFLTYDHPDQWPEYFEAGNRHEKYHLTSAAARRFTERLAEDFVAMLERGPAEPGAGGAGPGG